MTRIKYIKVGQELITPEILCGTQLLVAQLHLPTLAYIVYESIGNRGTRLKAEGNATTLVGLKKKVKAVLMELGANFDDEIRGKKAKLK